MFDEMLEIVFIHIFGWLTYAERCGELTSVRDSWVLDMKIAWVLTRSKVANLVV